MPVGTIVVSPRPPQPSWLGPVLHDDASKPGWRQAVPGSVAVDLNDHTSPCWTRNDVEIVDARSEPGVDALPEVSIATTW